MDNTLLLRIHKEYNVPEFHGNVSLDTLKYLSELDSLPELIRVDYEQQYNEKIYGVGSSTNYSLGKQVYAYFNGDDNVVLGETVAEHSWKNVTIQARKITIPYLKRLSAYAKSIGEYNPFKQMCDEYVVIHIIIDDYSLLQSFLKKPFNELRMTRFGVFFPINIRDYTLIENFSKPYNGIGSNSLPGIFADLIKRAYNDENIISYLISLYNTLDHYTNDNLDIKKLIR